MVCVMNRGEWSGRAMVMATYSRSRTFTVINMERNSAGVTQRLHLDKLAEWLPDYPATEDEKVHAVTYHMKYGSHD